MKRKKHTVKKKKYIKQTLFLLAAACLILAVSSLLLLGRKKDWAAIINGDKIYVEQLRSEMELMRSQILGETPDAEKKPEVMEEWRQAAMENCLRRQILLSLAKREGLIESADYKQLLREMELENKKRLETDQSGGIVYGILEYTESTYFTYLLSNLMPKLLAALSEKELSYEEADLLRYFEEHRIAEQSKPEYYSIFIYSGGKEADGVPEQLASIKKELDAGKTPGEIKMGPDVNYAETKVTREGRVAQRSSIMEDAIFSLKEGENSGIFEDGGEYRLLYCIAIVPAQQLTYEESREYVRKLYLEQRFSELLDRLLQDADITMADRNH